MLSFKNAMELLRDKESQLHKEHSILEKKSVDLERESINVEAMRISIQETVDSNFDVQRMQKALQNFAFNIQTLASENRVLHAQIKSLNNDIERKTIEFEELKEENERVLAATINLTTLSDDHAEKEHISKEKSTEIEKPEKVSREPLVSSDDESSSTDYETIHQKEDKQDRVQLKTVVFDNSKEYERRVEMVKETARLCIQSYKEQLDQKDRAIEQYRVMLENSRISFAETPHDTSTRPSDSALPLKKSTEILNNLKLEEKEKEVRKLEQEIQELERINAELGLELKRFGESNISTKKHLFDVAIQTDHFTGSGSAVNVVVQSTTTKESSDSEELSSKDEPHTQERNYEDEFEESDQSSRVSSEGSTSDSGTVEDIDKPPSRRGSRTSSLSSNQGQQPDLPPKPVEPKKDGEHSLPASSRTEASDHAVIRLRSEIRNLR
uniref:Shootin-1 n=1 Tax=Acrobeloides nanus TaxID=290746 RepID=A0A914CZL3_9BILA